MKLKKPKYFLLEDNRLVRIGIDIELLMVGGVFKTGVEVDQATLKDLNKTLASFRFFTTKEENKDEIHNWIIKNNILVHNIVPVLNKSELDSYKKSMGLEVYEMQGELNEFIKKTISYENDQSYNNHRGSW
jgi:hypothetical protein